MTSCPSDRAKALGYPTQVLALRRLVLTHRHLAMLLCIGAFALKLLIPSGYMISGDRGTLTITICSGTAPKSMTMDMLGTHGDMSGSGHTKEHSKPEIPCAFSGLSAQALGGVDPLLLVAAIAFVMAIGLRPLRLVVRPPTPYLRPPLRGPPARL